MKVAEEIAKKIERLPPDKQREVLDFAGFLEQRCASEVPGRNPEGLWADLNVDITEADIEGVRSEMWKGFPREDIP